MCAQSESRPPVQFALFHNLLSCGTNINAGSRSAPRASHQLLSSQLPEFPPQPLGCCRDCQLFPQPLRLINPASHNPSKARLRLIAGPLVTKNVPTDGNTQEEAEKNTLKNRRNKNDKVKKMFTSNLLPVHLSQNVPTTPCLGRPYPVCKGLEEIFFLSKYKMFRQKLHSCIPMLMMEDDLGARK